MAVRMPASPAAAFRHLSDYHGERLEIDGLLGFHGFEQEWEDLEELQFAFYSSRFRGFISGEDIDLKWMLPGLRQARAVYLRLSQGVDSYES